MNNIRLIGHPTNPSNVTYGLTVSISMKTGGGLSLCYRLTGDLTHLRIPAQQPPTATDGLWLHTCFEAFVAVAGEAGYHEFNFSPSGQWAAYAFSSTRVRREWIPAQAPVAIFTQTPDALVMEAVLPALDLTANPSGKSLQLALTAVLETQAGQLSYWALHHPSANPDFHDREGFRVILPSSFQPSPQPL